MIRTSIEGKPNIVLIGFMGCGKTSAGKAAARLLGMDFLDTDTEIERAEGMSIPDIFRARGETYFREAESRAVRLLAGSGLTGAVISAGGGIVKNAENMRLMRALGTVVYLRASPKKILENININGRQDRPLLDVPDPEGEAARLLAEREPLYELFCDACVDCGALDVEETAQKVAEIARNAVEARRG